MAWTTPKTWASGYVVLAADLNTHLRDNLNVTAPAVMSSQGDVLFASGSNTPARLAKSTTTTQYLANTGTNNNPAWNEVALATGVSGTLPVGNGGTGATTFTANGILVGNSTSAVAVTATMATKGHLMAGDGSGVPSMLAVGSNDEVLTADSGEATGVKWATAQGASAASQAEMEAASSTSVYASPGRTVYHPGVAKVWCTYNMIGTIAITESYNMTSLTDGGAGDCLLTFDDDFASAGYAGVGITQQAAGTGARAMITYNAAGTKAVGSGQFLAGATNNAGIDEEINCVVIHGDQ